MTATTQRISKKKKYKQLLPQLREVIQGEPDATANLANAMALINQTFEAFSWVGVYLKDTDEELVVGPYQGKLACTRIPKGQGVCGTVFQNKELMCVKDVSQLDNHIYCDPDTQSEIVLPLQDGGEVWGVLDIDSYTPGYFDETDVQYLQKVARLLPPLVSH